MHRTHVKVAIRILVIAVYQDVGQMNIDHKSGVAVVRLKIMMPTNRIGQALGKLPAVSKVGPDFGMIHRKLLLLGLIKGQIFVCHARPYFCKIVLEILLQDHFADVVQQAADETVVR